MRVLHTHYAYIAILLFSLAGLSLADWRQHLVLFAKPGPAIRTWLVLMALFVAWDVAGINLHIFATNPRYVTGLYIGSPNLPFEEFLFLTLLIYVNLVLVVTFGNKDIYE